MATFHFHLARALHWFREQCAIEENKLAVCLGALRTARESAAGVRRERLSVESEVISRVAIAPIELSSLGLYRLRMAQTAAQLDKDCIIRERVVEFQQKMVMAAQRRVRMLEKLRERRLAEYMTAEGKALEEVAADAYLAKWIKGEAQKCQLQ